MNISFTIPAYNCQDFIEEAINSIYQGNFEEGDEVIIVDDASTDNTPNILQKLKGKYSSIILFKHNYNKGSAAAGRNTGIDNSKHDLIFCLDADNVLAPNSVPLLKEKLLNENLDAVAFGEICYFIGNIDNVTHSWFMNKKITFIDNINFPEKTPCSSGNYLFTKESWIKAGRYNESIGGAQDSWAFGCLQLLNDASFKTLKGTKYFHRHGYNSTYVREVKKCSPSITTLQILLPYLDKLHPKDVEYILSAEYRHKWFDTNQHKKKKIRLKSWLSQNLWEV